MDQNINPDKNVRKPIQKYRLKLEQWNSQDASKGTKLPRGQIELSYWFKICI